MATYSSNTTIKIGSSVSQNSFNFSYTVPANCYLELVYTEVGGYIFVGSASYTITLPSGGIWYSSTNANEQKSYPVDGPGNPKLPSGTVITASTSGSLFGNPARLEGILFQNTP